MTPPITKSLMASRPLYDPDPDTFVAEDAVQNKELRRARLFDFTVIAFRLNIKAGKITKGAVDVFENVYVRGAKPRTTRVHEGRPALAPDGTVMSMGDSSYPGSSGRPAGQWNVENVDQCAGYPEWIAKITQSEAEMVKRGFSANDKNTPLPLQDELAAANAYVPTPVHLAKASKAAVPKRKRHVVDGDDPVKYAKGMIQETVQGIEDFFEFVATHQMQDELQSRLIARMKKLAAAALKNNGVKGEGSSAVDEEEEEHDNSGGEDEDEEGETQHAAERRQVAPSSATVGKKLKMVFGGKGKGGPATGTAH